MKLTRHNGRSGKHGTYNPKHNDRTFDVSNSEHIDEERAKHNVYWDCFNGYRTFAEKQVQSELADTFEEVEELFYSAKYGAYVEAQNARNDKNRHSERNRTTTDLLKDKRTCPEETIYQIGKMGDHVSPDVLLKVVTDFFVEMERRFGSHVHILDWALHLDEATPHIQERHVFDCENRYGEICPQQEKALEALGFELPDPTKKQGRHNNRKMTFDSACRAMLFDIAKGMVCIWSKSRNMEGEPILKTGLHSCQTKEQLEVQEQRLEELTLKIEDVETLIDDVADIAYDKAVEVVTDTVRVETHKEDIRLIEETKTWLQSPERKAPKKERDYAISRLDGVIGKIKMPCSLHCRKSSPDFFRRRSRKRAKSRLRKRSSPPSLPDLKETRNWQTGNEARRSEHRPHKKQNMEL